MLMTDTIGYPCLVLACVASAGKYLGSRETHKGEVEYLSERPMKIVSLPSPITWQPLHDLAKILTENN